MSDLPTLLWEYYHDFGRELPWREPEADGSFDPYKIMVSEIMLQQTQVSRVIPKYQEFLTQLPTVHDLAKSSLGDVLRLWQGLGYNRRAKFLWQAAQKVEQEYKGVIPDDQMQLTKLPGIGINTAGAICAYAYNQPIVFVETNIRTVYIHHFFNDRDDVHDKELMPIIEQTIDKEHPREFYWALMDYGSHLKQEVGNVSRSSKHYAKQSKFEGSRRQIRGQILKLLGTKQLTSAQIATNIGDERLESVLADLAKEGLITDISGTYQLADF